MKRPGSITTNAIDTLLREFDAAPTPDSEFYVLQLGGAVADAPEDATAYSGRQAAYCWIAEPVWDDSADDERCVAWGRAAATKISDQSIQANYVNEQGDTAIAPSAYGALKYERLARLKARAIRRTSSALIKISYPSRDLPLRDFSVQRISPMTVSSEKDGKSVRRSICERR
jgi:hypothetical protein